MEKIDISQSVKTLEFGSKYEARIQRIFREFDIKTIRDLCQWPGKDLVRVRDMGRKSIEEIEDVLEDTISGWGCSVRNWTNTPA